MTLLLIPLAVVLLLAVCKVLRDAWRAGGAERVEHGRMVERMERRKGLRYAEFDGTRFTEIAVDRHPLGHVTRTTHYTDPDHLIAQLADEGET